ncbi:GAF domain-containing protein [Pseudomonas tremae]|uniref:GAF domain-containing protein n=2 Tax=Pseudomonas syringae group TaxID=136849 RepID=A0AA40PAJ1_9PSED|nr:diguanylate cyclase [Pseudomonas coronafaciens]KPY02645.1 GAF domain-containing protein [Pseudomonas coronafaciens pv. oryzae]KPZ07850.1 GAF domain-containing protein [Pseudomonas tremae]RMN90972.1 GAF domain-containing protein [Pseudomonas coronafaciens pv. coronafaciens]RMO08206.1 GAF domain-containing protein [Pseudomonas coronafaciens pv. zizaniae]RMS01657.1 GAF domain-containing protein [Pseudomonas coronafaciens pv. garcae]
MSLALTTSRSCLTTEERSAIAEIEATTNVLRLVTRLTGMRFAGIAKFTESDWIACSVYDPTDLGIDDGDVFPLETTLCSELCINPQPLFVPQISQNGRYANRPVVKRYAIESYAGVPIYLPDGQLYGALCALDSQVTLFEDPDLPETLTLFARLIGCIFFANITDTNA